MSKKNNRKRKKTGYAETKEVPHRKHPANYKNIGKNKVEYITFTHHEVVEINGKKYITIPLTDNIDKKEQKLNKNRDKKIISHAYPTVFVASRSALGSEVKKFSLVEQDKKIVSNLFQVLPKQKVSYTSNSKKKKKT